MQYNSTSRISRPTKPIFNQDLPLEYGDFIVKTCTLNNCLGRLEGDYYIVTEEQAIAVHETQADEDEQEVATRGSRDQEPKASNQKLAEKTLLPSTGSTPFATSKKARPVPENERISMETAIKHDAAERIRLTVGTASTAYAFAAIKRAQQATKVFINRKTGRCDTHQERTFYLELYMFITDGLPKAITKDIVVGDINAIYLRVMTLGQANAMITQRYLSNQLGSLKKGSLSWPRFRHQFETICDAMAGCLEASGAPMLPDSYLLVCLLTGLQADTRYERAIHEIETSANPLTLAQAMIRITAHATQAKDDSILATASESAHAAEARTPKQPRQAPKATNVEPEPCRNFAKGRPCVRDPCPFSHVGDKPPGASPKPKPQIANPKKPCMFLVKFGKCKYADACYFSHDPAALDKAKKEHATDFAGSAECADYFEEALHAETQESAEFTVSQTHQNSFFGQSFFRHPQGSPDATWEREKHFRSETGTQRPPTSQDKWSSRSKPSTHCDPDCCQANDDAEIAARNSDDEFDLGIDNIPEDLDDEFGWVRSAILLSSEYENTETSPLTASVLTVSKGACLNQAALRDGEHVESEYALAVHTSNTGRSANARFPVIDTGASSHMMPLDLQSLDAAIPGTVTQCCTRVKTADKESSIVGAMRADFYLAADTNDPADRVLLRSTLLVEGLRRGLISASALTNDGYALVFEAKRCVLSKDSRALITIQRQDANLYELNRGLLNDTTPCEEAHLARTYSDESPALWHSRYGHNSTPRLSGLFQEKGISLKAISDDCVDCTQAKIHRTNYPKATEFRAEFCGQSFAVDFAGPFRVRSPFGHKYFCLFVDVRSRHGCLIPAKLKSELPGLVDQYIALVERQQQPNKVVTIVSDGALCTTEHRNSLRARGITALIAAPGASRLNGIVERRIRTNTESGRAMNIAAGLPPTLFIPACEYANIIQNYLPLTTSVNARITTSSDSLTTRNEAPQEIWMRRRLGSWTALLKPFRVFGCLAYALHRDANKQVGKAERCIFLGLSSDNHNTYVLMSLETKEFSRFVNSRDVVCHEHILPFKKAMELPAYVRENHALEHGALELSCQPPDAAQEQPTPLEPSPVIEDQMKTAEQPDETITPAVEPVHTLVEKFQPHDEASVNKRLSFSEFPSRKVTFDLESNQEHAPTHTTDFDQRKLLGTGDERPHARSAPADYLHVGRTYMTTGDERCTVREVNSDGDVQATFPDFKDPKLLFTLAKENILEDTEETMEEAMLATNMPTSCAHYAGPLDAYSIETADGEFMTPGEFTASTLTSESAFSADCDRPLTGWKNRKSKIELGTRITNMKPLTINELVGQVMADSVKVPRTHYELKDSAIRPLVEEAQNLELATLIRKNVFKDAHTALPTDVVIPSMFVNRAKGDAEGKLVKIKSRLTLRGDLDKPPADAPRKTYAPVLLPCTMRLLISQHSADIDTNFHQLDHEAAFVSSPAVRRIVIRLPAGYFGPGPRVPNAVHVLNFNLYGGDDAPLVYQQDMFGKHKKMGFNGIMQDHCYMELIRGNEFIKFVVHVDDFLIAQKGKTLWDWYCIELKKHYQYTLAPLSYYVGMRFTRDPATGRYAIDQEAQIDKMCRAFGIDEHARNAKTPISSFSDDDRLRQSDAPTDPDEKAAALKIPYRQAVGHLSYLASCTHFEVMLPTRLAAAFVQEWGTKHWTWVKQIMRYLKTKSSKLFYVSGSLVPRALVGYTDADHAGNPDNRKSMSAHQIWLGDDLIDWYCKTQTIVSHSSAESELMALDPCARQMQYLRWLVVAMHMPPPNEDASIVYIDSSSALSMAENPIQNRRNRHIHARYYYVSDLINDGIIKLRKIASADNRADLLATYKDLATFKRLLHLCKPQPPE